jgi:CDP-diacylglycerol pyrophosphatase
MVPSKPSRAMNPRTLAVALTATIAVSFVALAVQRETQRDRLRVIVQEQCVPHWLATHRAAPCSSVSLPEQAAADTGYAVLHDRKGGAHYLLIPTRTLRGIESPGAYGTGAVNYFDAAWRARGVLSAAGSPALPRAAIGLAVNPLRARSQDQLHIHLSCLKPGLMQQLTAAAPTLTQVWQKIQFDGRPYLALRLRGTELGTRNPIDLLAAVVGTAPQTLEQYSLLVAGTPTGEPPGFILLAGSEVPEAELMLDPTCSSAD